MSIVLIGRLRARSRADDNTRPASLPARRVFGSRASAPWIQARSPDIGSGIKPLRRSDLTTLGNGTSVGHTFCSPKGTQMKRREQHATCSHDSTSLPLEVCMRLLYRLALATTLVAALGLVSAPALWAQTGTGDIDGRV